VAKIYYTIYPNYLQDQVFTNKAEDIWFLVNAMYICRLMAS
jgi:hypothetical protein